MQYQGITKQQLDQVTFTHQYLETFDLWFKTEVKDKVEWIKVDLDSQMFDNSFRWVKSLLGLELGFIFYPIDYDPNFIKSDSRVYPLLLDDPYKKLLQLNDKTLSLFPKNQRNQFEIWKAEDKIAHLSKV